MTRRILPAALAAALAISALGCAPKPGEGTVEASLDVGDRTRSYLYHLPSGWTAQAPKKWPLVIALHGRLGQGASQEKLTHFSAIADREGFVVVYPDGIGKSWNDYRHEGPAADDKVDDVAYLSALITTFVRDHAVDDKRVYVTGMSNGAMMTYSAACELSDRVAAFGPVAGLLPEGAAEGCKPKRGVPMMIVAGTEDKLVPYHGGDVARDRGRVHSAEQTRDIFATKNGCGSPGPARFVDVADDGTRVAIEESTGCKDGADVVLVTVEGGGHGWPSGDQYLPEWAIGKTSRDVDASEELWKFFQRHPLP